MPPCGAARTIWKTPTASPPATCVARSTSRSRCSPGARPPSSWRRQPRRSPPRRPSLRREEARPDRRERHAAHARRPQAERSVSDASTPTPAALPGTAPRRRNFVMRYLARFDDGEVVRWAFRGMLLGTIGVLALDLRDLSRENGWWAPEAALPASALRPDPAAGRRDRLADPVRRSAPLRHHRRGDPWPADDLHARQRRRACRRGQHRSRLRRAFRRRDRGAGRICEDRLAELAGRRARRRHGDGEAGARQGHRDGSRRRRASAPRPARSSSPAA